jgi:hypothetical protein
MTDTTETPELEEDAEVFSSQSHYEWRVMLTDQGTYEIREVYFDKDGLVTGWTAEANAYWGDTLEDLSSSFGYAAHALTRPVLVETDLPGYVPADTEDVTVSEESAPQ